jgi:hypothetical protein
MKTKDRHEEMFRNHDFSATTLNGIPVKSILTERLADDEKFMAEAREFEIPTGSDGMSPQEVKEFMKVKGEYASPENEGLDVFGVALTVLGILLIIGIVFLRLL